MPFTFSHPAAVLPLWYLPKRFISMTGLVAGSIAPDFEYFIRLSGVAYYSHTWAGIFYFDLPLTILLAFLFHGIVRDILTDNLPVFLAGRLSSFKSFDWTKHFRKNILVVLISIVVGSASHILVDDFTHAHTMFTDMFGTLSKRIYISGHYIPVFAFLQYLGSVIGAVIILYAIFQLPADKSYQSTMSIFPFWLSVCLIMLVVVLMKYFLGHFPGGFEDRIGILVSGWLCGVLSVCVFQKYIISPGGSPARENR